MSKGQDLVGDFSKTTNALEVIERGRGVVLRSETPILDAEQLSKVVATQQNQIEALVKILRTMRDETKEKLLTIVDGKMLILDPVLSQRLQTMSERLQHPTYSVQIRGFNGKLRPANVLAVGSFAGTVQLTIDEGINATQGTNISPPNGAPDYRG